MSLQVAFIILALSLLELCQSAQVTGDSGQLTQTVARDCCCQGNSDEQRRILNLGKEWKYPAWSCQEVAKETSNPDSDWYWIQSSGASPSLVFCDFTIKLMGKENWMRVFHLNMSDPQDQCPSQNFRTVTGGGLRLCGRSSGPGCSSMYTPTASGYVYRRVCGRFVGYRYHTTDGFVRVNDGCSGCDSDSLSGPYLDGFSVTYGLSNYRKHLWSFAMGGSTAAPPFIGRNYFYETTSHYTHDRLYAHDPLFAGRQFCVEFPKPTAEPLEVRICSDQDTENEDALLQFAELYIQ